MYMLCPGIIVAEYSYCMLWGDNIFKYAVITFNTYDQYILINFKMVTSMQGKKVYFDLLS